MSSQLRTKALALGTILMVALSSAFTVPAMAAESIATEPAAAQDTSLNGVAEENTDPASTDVADSDQSAESDQAPSSGEDASNTESPSVSDGDSNLQVADAQSAKTPAAASTANSAEKTAQSQETTAKVDPNNKCGIPTGVKSGHKAFKTKGVTRFSSASRYLTSTTVFNRAASTKSKEERAVFIASATDFSRGAALTALASKFGWPVITTNGKAMGKTARASVKKVNPTHIYIAGGTGVVSKAVENTARSLGTKNVTVQRFSGTRYTAAQKMSECYPSGSAAFVASPKNTSGKLNTSEVLIASAAAVKAGGALVLTDGYRATSQAKQSIKNLKSKKIYAIGGKWSTATQNALKKSGAKSATLKVYAGKNRYETSSRVATAFWAKSARSTVVYTRADSRKHGLAALSVSRQANAPVLLTKKSCRPDEIATVSKGASSHIVLGSKQHLSTKSYNTSCTPKPTKEQTLVEFAKSLDGKAYKKGGEGPNSFDCSGFTQYVYAKVGIKIPRTPKGQWAAGTVVKSPKPGDIAVMHNGGHVAIYLGNGMIVDAGNARLGVSIRKIYAPVNAYVRFT